MEASGLQPAASAKPWLLPSSVVCPVTRLSVLGTEVNWSGGDDGPPPFSAT